MPWVAIAVAAAVLAGAPVRRLSPPASVLQELVTQALEPGRCNPSEGATAGPLGSERYVALPGGRLLLMLQVPDYMCGSSNEAVPVVVDEDGTWSVGRALDGQVEQVLVADDGTIWLVLQWAIEGTVPSVWWTRDGLSWRELTLPEPRGTYSPTERLEPLCFRSGQLFARFEGDDDDVPGMEWWSTLREPAMRGAPRWHRGRAPDKCSKGDEAAGDWRRSVEAHEAVFRRGSIEIRIPLELEWPEPLDGGAR